MKQRADGRWQKTKTINGKRIFFFSSEPTERKALRDIENQMLNYIEKEENGPTFGKVIDEWQSSPQYERLSPTTIQRYEVLSNRLSPFFNEYIKNIKAEDIQDFLLDMSYKGYATKTIIHQFSIFKIVFNFARMRRYIKEDETKLVVLPEGEKAVKRRALTEGEVAVVEKYATDEDGLLPYLILNTGLRRGEACALTYGDIDYDKCVAHINKSAYYDGNQSKIKAPKTEAGERDVILPERLLKILPKGKKDHYIFPHPKNPKQPMTQSVYTRKWSAYLKKTGLNITAHMLRHTYATILFEANIGVKDAQVLMGHADIMTTNNIYTHIRENRMKETANQLNAFLNKQS